MKVSSRPSSTRRSSSSSSSNKARSTRPASKPSSAKTSAKANRTDRVNVSKEARSSAKSPGVSSLTDGLKANYAPTNAGPTGFTPNRERASGSDASALAGQLREGSPSARRALDDFHKKGGTFVDGGDASYYQGGEKPVIGLSSRGTDADRRGAMAHELGHHDFASMGLADAQKPTYGPGKTDHQIEQRREAEFVQKNTETQLANEAYANRFNMNVRDEMLQSGGPAVGVSGVDSGPFRGMPSTQEMKDGIAGMTPSTARDKNYRSFYNDFYIKQYQQLYAPGRE